MTQTHSGEFEPHPVEWNPPKIARFWDTTARLQAHGGNYFSAQVGDTVLDLVSQWVDLRAGRVLDYGSGPGFLVEKLAARSIAVDALDTSPDSLSSLEHRLECNPHFGRTLLSAGPPSPAAAGTYDTVFFLETIEHLLQDEVAATLADIHRLVRSGGVAVVSTPNAEPLEERQVLCPDCGCTFHPIQHVSSWTPERLTASLRDAGFTRVRTYTTTLLPSLRSTQLLALYQRLRRQKPVNLLAVATRD